MDKLKEYFTDKQDQLDRDRDAGLDSNRQAKEAEADSDPHNDEGMGGDYDADDDEILDTHAERTAALNERIDITFEKVQRYQSNKESDNPSEFPTTPLNKRVRDEEEDDSNHYGDSSNKKIKQSPVDFVIEKESLELPPLVDSDGGE